MEALHYECSRDSHFQGIDMVTRKRTLNHRRPEKKRVKESIQFPAQRQSHQVIKYPAEESFPKGSCWNSFI